MPRPSPFLLHGWIAAWWRDYGGGSQLAVHLARRNGRLVGALPLFTSRQFGLRVTSFPRRPATPVFADVLPLQKASYDVAHQLAGACGPGCHTTSPASRACPADSRLAAVLGPAWLRLQGADRGAGARSVRRLGCRVPCEDRRAAAQAPPAPASAARRARRIRGDDRTRFARGCSRPSMTHSSSTEPLARTARHVRLRESGRPTLPPRCRRCARRGRDTADPHAQARRAADRLPVLPRLLRAHVHVPARVRPGLRAVLAGHPEHAADARARRGRRSDHRGVPRRGRAVQGRAMRPLRSTPRRPRPCSDTARCCRHAGSACVDSPAQAEVEAVRPPSAGSTSRDRSAQPKLSKTRGDVNCVPTTNRDIGPNRPSAG